MGTPIPRAVLGDQRDAIQEPLAPAETQGGSDYEVTGPQAGPGISVSARAARCGSRHTPIESRHLGACKGSQPELCASPDQIWLQPWSLTQTLRGSVSPSMTSGLSSRADLEEIL